MAPRRGLQLLPDYQPRVYLQGRVRVLRCCRRDVEVRATSEEKIRQRVLHWLLSKEGKERIHVEVPVHFTKRQRGRADIVVRDAQARPSVIVECKRPGSTGYDAEVQAIRYARRLGAKHVWVTDGTEHKALAKMRDGTWREARGLPFVHRLPASSVPVLPGARCSLAEAKLYVHQFDYGRPVKSRKLVRFALAIYRLIFADSVFPGLPYSWRGLHILEDRGVSHLAINTPGGPWKTFYRVFLVATEGRVETAALGLNFWDTDSLRLCVAVLTPPPAHHVLQLDVSTYCKFNGDGSVDIYHDGRIGGRAKPRSLVLESLREIGRDDLLTEDRVRPIHLGRLPAPERITWAGTRILLANLLHYGMTRHAIRKAYPYSATV